MIRQLMTSTASLNMVIFGLVVFTTVFITISLWVFRKSGKEIYNFDANLPLMKDKEI